MKLSFGVLFLVSIAFCQSQSSEEDKSGSLSSSFESSEPDLAKDDSEYDSSDYNSYEISLADEDWKKATLTEINKMRKKAKLPALKMNENLSTKAQKKASDQCKTGNNKPSTNENLAALKNNPSLTALGKKAVAQWYNEYKKNDCRPIYQGKIASDPHFKAVKNYLNMMSKKYQWVGLGLANNCARPKGTGFVVANFGAPPGATMRVVNGELAAQGLKRSSINDLDISRFAPCPKSFKN